MRGSRRVSAQSLPHSAHSPNARSRRGTCRTPFAVGTPFRIAPLKIINLRNSPAHEKDPGKLIHVMCDTPAGFYIDAHSGAILGYPDAPGEFVLIQFLVDLITQEMNETDRMTIIVKHGKSCTRATLHEWC